MWSPFTFSSLAHSDTPVGGGTGTVGTDVIVTPSCAVSVAPALSGVVALTVLGPLPAAHNALVTLAPTPNWRSMLDVQTMLEL